MKNAKEIVVAVLGYPLCILSLAAVPYGVYSLLVYRYEFTGFLKYVAIGIAVVCAIVAFCEFLCARDAKNTERRTAEIKTERDRIEKLYWEYEKRCRDLEEQGLGSAPAPASQVDDGTVHPEEFFASMRGVAENNRLFREGKAQAHFSPDITPEQVRRNMEYNLARELKLPEEEQYRKWLSMPEFFGKSQTRAEAYTDLSEDERRARFAEYHYKQLRQYLGLIRDGGYFDY